MSSNFDLFNLFQDIDFFDSNIIHLDSKIRQFNEIANFLQNLQHCQFLYWYRKTNFLNFLFNCLNDSTFEWLKKRLHFDFLHIFNIVLTIAFSSQLKARAQKIAKRKIRKIAERVELKTTEVAKSTSKFQNIDIFDSTACNESEFELYNEIAKFLQHLQQRQHQYRKSDLLNLLSKRLCDHASEWFKTQFEFISLKRFDKTLAKAFLEAFVRCVSLRSSNLQLKTFDVISESIENLSSSEITCARVICKFCKQSFNFNKKLYEHICKLCKQSFNFNRKLYEHICKHETLKSVKNSSLSIKTVNLVCEIEKKSFVTHVSFALFARSQNLIFESATTFKSIILLKRSILSSSTFETVSKLMKSTSMQCLLASFSSHVSQISAQKHQKFDVQNSLIVNSFLLIDTVKSTCEIAKKSTTCRHCKQTFKFKELLRKHKREQHAKKFIINSSLLSHALNSVCKTKKKSAVKSVTNLFASQKLHIFARKHQKIDVQKHSVVSSHLSINTVNLICEIKKTSFASLKLSASSAKSQKSIFESAITFKIITLLKHSNLSSSTLEIKSKSTKKSITCSHCLQLISEQKVEWRFRMTCLFARLKTSRLNLSLNTFVIISKTMKNASIQEIACVRTLCKSCKQNFNFNKKLFEHIREHETLKRINTIKATCKFVKISTFSKSIISFKNSSFTSFTLKSLCEFEKKSTSTHSSLSHESLIFTTSRNLTSNTKTSLQFVSSKRSNFQLRVLNCASKSMKNASTQSIVCVSTICKRCNCEMSCIDMILIHNYTRTSKWKANTWKSAETYVENLISRMRQDEIRF